MNPQDENQQPVPSQTPDDTPQVHEMTPPDTSSSSPNDSGSAAPSGTDEAIQQHIDALESESTAPLDPQPAENTPVSLPAEDPYTPEPSVETPVTIVPPTPAPSPADTAPATAPQTDINGAIAEVETTQAATPAQTQPTGIALSQPKKSTRTLIVVVVLLIIVAAGAVGGYFLWQALNTPAPSTADTTQTVTGGDAPGGNGKNVKVDATVNGK